MKELSECPVTTALSVLGGKWKVIILWQLTSDARRFGELQKSIAGISQKMLTQELRGLEASGLISRTVFPVVPPKVEYALTDLGKTLGPVLEQLCLWGQGYQNHLAAPLHNPLHNPSSDPKDLPLDHAWQPKDRVAVCNGIGAKTGSKMTLPSEETGVPALSGY